MALARQRGAAIMGRAVAYERDARAHRASMPDTLIDPVRPTVVDEPAPDAPPDEPPPDTTDDPRPPDEPPRPTRTRRRAWLAVVIAVLATAAAAAAVAWFLVLRYEPTARRHIPGDANIALRLEGADLALFPPVQRHLLPLLEEGAASASRAARIKAVTGLDLSKDIREIVIASTDAARWVALAGGRIPKGRVLPGLERIAREDGWISWRREGDLLLGPRGVAIAQADDGTLAIGTDADVVKAALPASDEWRRLDLPDHGAVTFALTQQAWGGAADALRDLLPRSAVVLRRVDHASGVLSLGKTPALTLRLAPASGEPATKLADDVQYMVSELRVVTLIVPDTLGEKAALRAARVEARSDVVELNADWPLEGLDRGCAKLADVLRGAPVLELPAPPSSAAPPRP
jgi:hypothetical protein